ncbi:hypothetical protein HYE60_11040 [Aggregatibacter actinomycetemcomitans]|uniref:hypothetical protein n=1 Tax=Aggregatibacter actinomycetemcomitans TaxID=714 RepID=UPI00197C0D00|nr:hypothetical protein [Aggregatibacter actinomycetemcomitans]MBN6075768.1 hypothetical protein [Aggregatibacter actinomycetemcomitans]
MNAEDFIAKQIRQSLIQGGVDALSANRAVDMCLREYRQRSSFKPDVMTYLLDKAKRFVKTSSKKGK